MGQGKCLMDKKCFFSYLKGEICETERGHKIKRQQYFPNIHELLTITTVKARQNIIDRFCIYIPKIFELKAPSLFIGSK